MLVLTIRTDRPESEIGLYDDEKKLQYIKWQAHRQLAETIHLKIKEILETNSFKITDLQGVIYYQGPGSFTGLRIGASVANALSKSLKIPLISANGEDWIDSSLSKLKSGKKDNIALPIYGQSVNITQQKK